MPNLVKQRMMEQLRRELGGAKAFLFLGTQGLTVQETTNLRAVLGEWNLRLRVVKNTLAVRSFADGGLDASAHLRGQTAVLAAGEDGILAAARVLGDAKKKWPKLEVRGGFFDGKTLGPADVAGLATIPSREVLLAQLLGSILGPATAVASLLGSTLAAPARLAAAHAAKLESEPVPAPPA